MYQWISWHQPTEDYRPLTYPPTEAVKGWWCSGYDGDGVATLCALVQSETEGEAQTIVKREWPEAERWRFCEARENTDLGDRFQPTGWMVERLRPNN